MIKVNSAYIALSLTYIISTYTCAAEQMIVDINAKQATALIEDNKKLVVLDVRSQQEFDAGHIEGAKLIDVVSPRFKDQIAKLDRQKSYLVHCASGRRSKAAISIMRKLGFQNVYHLESGYIGWQAVEKTPTN